MGETRMRLGLVGKPNVGKSTLFSALTLAKVDIANYPFCTIDPNIGVAFIPLRFDCPCKGLREKLEADGKIGPVTTDDPRGGSICTPRTGTCKKFRRLVPCHIVDVAGLVPGASEGRGRGNAFLNDLASCDALIQVVDAANTTDIEGNPKDPEPEIAHQSMLEEIQFLSGEIESWIAGLIADGWSRGIRKMQAEGAKGLTKYLVDKLSGIGVSLHLINQSLESSDVDIHSPWDWSEKEIRNLAANIQKTAFPIIIAANKSDLSVHQPWNKLPDQQHIFPIMADAELALRRADKSGFIDYFPEKSTFELTNKINLTASQEKGIQEMNRLLNLHDGTGIVSLFQYVIFDLLDQIVVFPVQDDNQWIDGEGKILPDAFIVKNGIQTKDFAYHIHTELGDGFIRGTDARSKRTIGADHSLSNLDVIKIHAKN